MLASTDELHRSWRRAWRGVGASGDGSALRDALLAAWAEPQRSYHTLQHLRECIALFDTCSDLATHAAEVELALWFHDAVYDVRRADNEQRSAAWARDALAAAGVASDVGARVASLVLATEHRSAPPAGDAQLVVDIDLAILAATPARFTEYEAQIRREYSHVDDATFKARRSAVLAAFAARARLYGTPRLHDALEQRARTNLADALGDANG